jgi:G3E family GTPase
VTPLANVPTLVVCVPAGAGKSVLIARLFAERPRNATWAVLAGGRGPIPIEPGEGVAVAQLGGGCVCCTAQVALRVALTKLLREARPERLFVELDAASHLRAAVKALREPWLAPVLAIEAVVCVVDGTRPDAVGSTLVDECDVVCIRGGPTAAIPRGKRVVDLARATLASLQGTSASEPR